MSQRSPHVYILASGRNGTLYIGAMSDLVGRIRQHKEPGVDGFAKRYGVHDLVWFEAHSSMTDAIAREKQLKKWRRAWKLDLIEARNPGWVDLYPALVHG